MAAAGPRPGALRREPARAFQHPSEPQRPDEASSFPIEPGKISTNDAGVLEPGQIEIQPGWLGFSSSRAYDQNGSSLRDSDQVQDLFFTQLTWGVVEDFDMNLILALNTGRDSLAGTDPVTGLPLPLSGTSFADSVFGTRWRFLKDEENQLSLAYLTYFTFPTGQHGTPTLLSLSQEAANCQHHLVVQKEAGHWSLLADLGVTHPLWGNSIDFDGGVSASVAAGYQVTAEWQPLVELGYTSFYFGNTRPSEFWTVTGGGTWYVSPDVRLNLGLTRTFAGQNARDGTAVTFFLTILR
ncbi:hypothetical protein DYH09_26355 [bacterium CPR1]|nr:hypothetical protein [bacterium CPR1]